MTRGARAVQLATVLVTGVMGPPAPTAVMAADVAGSGTAAEQTMRVDIRGAVAHVTVTRRLPCAARRGGEATDAPGGPGGDVIGDAILDLALPERSALLGVDVLDGGRPQETKPLDITKARDAYLESLRAMGLAGGRLTFEDEVGFRIRLGCRSEKPNYQKQLRYYFTVLLEPSGDRARILFPASPEASPPLTRVEVRVQPSDAAAEVSIAGAARPLSGGTMSENVSTRARWLISLDRLGGRTIRADGSRLKGLASVAPAPRGGSRLMAYALAASPSAPRPLPARVLFLVDRSRSVGPGGLEAERNLAKGLLESLSPATRFDVLFFDRGQKRLFAVPRAATREAITAFEDEMVASRLGNGTDLVGVLRAAGDLMRREANDFGPRTLLVVLSDGAVGSPTAGNDLGGLLGPLPGIELAIAAISVRPNDDPAVSPGERRVLRGLAAAAPAGGIERALRTADVADAPAALLDSLRAGGDVHAVEIAGAAGARGARQSTSPLGRLAAPTAGERADGVAEVIAPGNGGATGVATAPAGPLVLRHNGQRKPSPLRPTPVDASWLTPFVGTALPDARLLVGPSLAVLVEPVFHAAPPSATSELGPSGYMERSVVRDALSLAFTPRARACYLTRSARTPAERDLTGRVRLALDLVRGEVGAARVESSTLGHPTIERCLREAAYALEVPRAYRNDDPVTAVLNLVFRPRNPERRPGGVENPRIADEIDLMVEAALKGSGQTGSAGDPKAPAGPFLVPADAGAQPDR